MPSIETFDAEGFAALVQRLAARTITVLAIMDHGSGKLTEPLEFFSRGFVEEAGWEKTATKTIEDALRTAAETNSRNREDVETLITRTMGRWLARRHRRNPVITTIVVEE